MRIKSSLLILLGITFLLTSPTAAQAMQQQNSLDALASLFDDVNVIGMPG